MTKYENEFTTVQHMMDKKKNVYLLNYDHFHLNLINQEFFVYFDFQLICLQIVSV